MRTTFDVDAQFRGLINDVYDYPKKGVVFRDIQPLLSSAKDFSQAIDHLCGWIVTNCAGDLKIVAIESRGFIFGAALATRLGRGLVLARKKGKLPGDVEGQTYDLEYGQATLEMARSSVKKGTSYVIVDDVLATGGTVHATMKLIQKLGGNPIAVVSLIELSFLNPYPNLIPMKHYSLVKYATPT